MTKNQLKKSAIQISSGSPNKHGDIIPEMHVVILKDALDALDAQKELIKTELKRQENIDQETLGHGEQFERYGAIAVLESILSKIDE